MCDIDDTYPLVGAYVLETLTTGMYTNALDSIREYVQNAYDSILDAERNDVLQQGAGRISINIDQPRRVVKIRDNGLGIKAADAPTALIDIGASKKKTDEHAGFRGIGRLAGIAYCDVLKFKTHAHQESTTTTVSFDCSKLIRNMQPSIGEVAELAGLLKTSARVDRVSDNRPPFFEVELSGINDAGQSFLDYILVNDYLTQVAPVGFDAQKFIHTPKISEWLRSHGISLPAVHLTVTSGNVNIEVFKPYRTTNLKTSRDNYSVRIYDVEYFPKDASSNSDYWIWIGKSNLPGTIADERVAGLRLRKNNICLGMADRIAELFTEISPSNSRFNKYFIGEVHILNHNVIPNARRDGVEDCQDWQAIKKSILGIIRDLSKEVRDASSTRNLAIDKLLRPAEEKVRAAAKKHEIGLASEAERTKIVSGMQKHIDKLGAAAKADRPEHEVRQLDNAATRLIKAKELIESDSDYLAKSVKASLDRKQRKLIQEILALLYDELKPDSFEEVREIIMRKYGVNKENSVD